MGSRVQKWRNKVANMFMDYQTNMLDVLLEPMRGRERAVSGYDPHTTIDKITDDLRLSELRKRS